MQLSLNKLSNFEEEFAIRQIERAIESGWTGVVFTGTERDYQEWLNIKYGKTGIQGQNNRNADKAAKARMLLDEYAAIEQGSSAIDHQTHGDSIYSSGRFLFQLIPVFVLKQFPFSLISTNHLCDGLCH